MLLKIVYEKEEITNELMMMQSVKPSSKKPPFLVIADNNNQYIKLHSVNLNDVVYCL